MKKIIVSLFLFLLIGVAPLFSEENHADLDAVLSHLFEEYQVETIDSLAQADLSSDDLALLGDAVMDSLINDPWRHEMFDFMYGGEGSASLDRYHSSLATDYLLSDGELSYRGGYGSYPRGGFGYSRGGFGYPRGGFGMGMHGFASPYRYSSRSPFGVSSFWFPYGHMIAGASVLLIVILIGVFAYRRSRKRPSQDALKQRLARGEISPEEYAKIKKVLNS